MAMGSEFLKRELSPGPEMRTPDSKRQRITAKIAWSKSKFAEGSLPDGTWGENSLGNGYLSCGEGVDYYFNKDGSSYFKTPTGDGIFVTQERETFYTPNGTSKQAGNYCTGVSWQTRKIITCWKDRSGVIVRTAQENFGHDEKLPMVNFLTYKTSDDDEIMYEVDEHGMHMGTDPDVIEDLRALPPPERRLFHQLPASPMRRSLFLVPEGTYQVASSLDFADAVMKIEEKDAENSLDRTAETPSVEIKLEDQSQRQGCGDVHSLKTA